MYGLDRRVKRILRELEERLYTDITPVDAIEIRRGGIPRDVGFETIRDGWAPYETGSEWAPPHCGEYALFRARITIPEEMRGKPVRIGCRTNRRGWNACNPQFLLYVDGEIRQGFDTNHMSARLSDRAESGRQYLLHLAAFGGLRDPYEAVEEEPTRLFLDIRVPDEAVWRLYHDLNVPLLHSDQLPRDSAEWAMVIRALNDACNLLDMRDPGGESFRESVRAASESLRAGLYENPRNTLPAGVSCVGHTHIDVAWLWRYCHTREKMARTMATALALMEEYPDFLFTMSQPQLFEFLREDYPGLYERVRERIRDGRLEIEGGMWVESDTNLPSGESLIRQFLYGKRFIREEFGRDSRILWLPDVFGYSAALPQILKKCGIEYFMTSKLKNNEVNKMPMNTFMWKGIDGTKILTQLTSYCVSGYNGLAHQCDMLPGWKEYQNKDLSDDILYTYGYGDGGGGPTREMIETVGRFKKGLPGGISARFSRAIEFFDGLRDRVKDHPGLPVWQGELYYEYHRGTYTSMARNKRLNRKAEFLYQNAEWAAALDMRLLSRPYPSETLAAGWKSILLNQFHDVLPGSSIREVYEDTDRIYEEVFRDGRGILLGALEHLAGNVRAPAGSLVVFNPLSWEREAAVRFEAPEGEWALAGGESVFPAQRSKDGGMISVAAGIPSQGWASFSIVPAQPWAAPVQACPALLENEFVRIRLDDAGNMISLYDRRAGREAFRPGTVGNRIIAYEDKPFVEDNWNLEIYYTQKSWDIPARSAQLVESGPVRTVARVRRAFMNSVIVQDVILWAHSPRIDFETTIDWREPDLCLKAEFPVDVNAGRATYEIQYGHITRSTHQNTSWDQAKFEVCAHKWADLSDGGFGLSLLNDCKYGYDALDGNLRLTLLRSTGYPNPDADKEIHRFTYSILPHAGDWRAAHAVRQAYDLNVPAAAVMGGGGKTLEPEFSFAGISSANIILEAVKRAEDGDGLILRLYDAWNMSGTCDIRFHAPIASACECDMLENPLRDARFAGDTLTFRYAPFEIKTFRVHAGK